MVKDAAHLALKLSIKKWGQPMPLQCWYLFAGVLPGRWRPIWCHGSKIGRQDWIWVHRHLYDACYVPGTMPFTNVDSFNLHTIDLILLITQTRRQSAERISSLSRMAQLVIMVKARVWVLATLPRVHVLAVCLVACHINETFFCLIRFSIFHPRILSFEGVGTRREGRKRELTLPCWMLCWTLYSHLTPRAMLWDILIYNLDMTFREVKWLDRGHTASKTGAGMCPEL